MLVVSINNKRSVMPRIVIRQASPQDLRARQELARLGPQACTNQAVWHFLFQETTLEAVVLCGAALFIWFGVSLEKLLLVPLLAVAVIAVSVILQHQVLGEKHAQDVANEWWGLVAEYRGPLLAPDAAPPPTALSICTELDCSPSASTYTQIIGTLSVSEDRESPLHCRMHAFVVHPKWRGRGAGRALGGAARAEAARRGRAAALAVLSELQPAARHLLHHLGWRAAGWWARRAAGGAYSLQLLQLQLPLPHV